MEEQVMAVWDTPARRRARGYEPPIAAPANDSRRVLLCLLRGVLAALLMASLVPQVSSAFGMPRISARRDRLYADGRPWRAWGMNWGIGDHAPVVAYFDNPTQGNLAVLRAELRTARAIGANSMRIYLQLSEVMATPTRARKRTLEALRKLLALAQSDRIYLDITGDLVWQPDRAPAWYGRMPFRQRWQVQARFWKAVAHAANTSPAVLCYELTSEPIVAQTPGYYYGQIGNWWFVQSIATSQGPKALALARSWTRLLADTVRSQDDRPVSIGLLPLTSGPFAPANIADLLDMLIVHEYPITGGAPAATSLIHSFAAFNEPVLLGETFTLTDDATTQGQFLTSAAPDLVGTLEFFDGRDPRTIEVHSSYDALYKTSLDQFIALRPQLLGPQPAVVH
jgi:hypothetical protein